MLRAPLPNMGAFTAALTNADVPVSNLVVDDRGTLCAPEALAPSGVALLPLQSEIVLKGRLSRGGMGEIFLAEQRSLGRAVAVKVATGVGAHAEAQLVVEARIAGQLDHPNIVPVHMLGASRDGKPVMVMKRIEGESWKQLLDKGREVARDIDILMNVCRALHFAHSRGVVHRDVKPANVMVGTFGEVYLLDWGIAVAFGDDTLPDVPHAKNVKRLVGTPQYMAPEMAFPEGGIDSRTDIYLVGAVLYELMTGRAPHTRTSLEESLHAAHTSIEPEFFESDDVPEELAEICRHAMQRDPRRRYQSADELLAALTAFQSHAVARELSAAAEERLATLLAMPADADLREAHRAFTESRFGFSLALRTWPQSTRAREGLERAIAGMAWRESEAGHYDSARLLAAELDVVPPALLVQLDDLKRRREAEAAEVVQLQKIKHERDVTIASGERAALVLGSAASWLLLLVVMHVLDRKGIYTAKSGTFAIVMGAIAFSVGAVGFLVPRIRSTVASRAMYLTLLICVSSIFMVHVAGWWFGLPPAPMLACGHTMLAAGLLTVAAYDHRVTLGAALAAAVVPSIMLWPAHVYLVSGVGCFVALVVMSLSWRER